MKFLGIEEEELINLGAVYTAKEITQQPMVWEKILLKVLKESAATERFLSDVMPRSGRIILTGAGTSAFIGISLRGAIQRESGLLTEAISTTDLVSHPANYFIKETPTLVISFARSGNSPESVAAVELADIYVDQCYHFFITCDPSGKLANYKTKQPNHVFILPPETNDKSLAMTSSYSGMLLAGLLIMRRNHHEENRKQVDVLFNYANRMLTGFIHELKEISEQDFHRAVFLGSGPFFGTATESQLKLQELTDGKVICKSDTFLGFRHGPKAVTNDETIVFYLFSNNEYTLRYEVDLVESMSKGNKALMEIGVSEACISNSRLDKIFCFSDDGAKLQEEFLCVCAILPAQILGFYKSLALGLRPDAPSQSGAISRVVEGVKIYKF